MCGDCVVWNGYHEPGRVARGGCSIWGERRSDEEACDRWFPKTELNRALYGKGR